MTSSSIKNIQILNLTPILVTRQSRLSPEKNKKSVSFAPGTKEKDAEYPNKYHIIDARHRSLMNESFPAYERVQAMEDYFQAYDPTTPNDYEDYCREKKTKLRLKRLEMAMKTETPMNATSEVKGGFAEKMLRKMGWEEGKGLGKAQQGISSCLVPSGSYNQLTEINKRISRCLCLVNMAFRTQLDAFLKEEVVNECSKFGEVIDCVVRINPRMICEPEEEVIVYVQFRYDVDCERAVIYMDGRFFGGRNVRCYFYDEERFFLRRFDE